MGFGLKISVPGVEVNNAKNNQLVLNSKYPFIKLDTQSTVAFQTINLVFFKDTPEPVGPSWLDTYTTVYQFKHGLNYTPKVWALFQVVTPPVGTHFYQAYFHEAGVIGAHTVDDEVSMYYTVDNQNVNIVVDKFNDGLGNANNLIGTVMKITMFVFVDDFTVS